MRNFGAKNVHNLCNFRAKKRTIFVRKTHQVYTIFMRKTRKFCTIFVHKSCKICSIFVPKTRKICAIFVQKTCKICVIFVHKSCKICAIFVRKNAHKVYTILVQKLRNLCAFFMKNCTNFARFSRDFARFLHKNCANFTPIFARKLRKLCAFFARKTCKLYQALADHQRRSCDGGSCKNENTHVQIDSDRLLHTGVCKTRNVLVLLRLPTAEIWRQTETVFYGHRQSDMSY